MKFHWRKKDKKLEVKGFFTEKRISTAVKPRLSIYLTSILHGAFDWAHMARVARMVRRRGSGAKGADGACGADGA